MNTTALQLTVDRVHRLEGDGSLKAFADVVIDEQLLVTGLRVVHGKKGLFVSMPRQESKQGKWFDIVKPLTKEMHAELTRTVLAAYQGKESDADA